VTEIFGSEEAAAAAISPVTNWQPVSDYDDKLGVVGAPSSAPPVILKKTREKPFFRSRLTPENTLPPYSLYKSMGELLTSRGPTTCDGERRVFDCPDGHERRIVYLGCGKYDCEAECAGTLSIKRAKTAWRKISRVGHVPWGVFVLTFPDFLHPLLTQKLLDLIRKRAWKILELWMARINGIDLKWATSADVDGWTFGALEFTHPAGEKYECRACDWEAEGSASAERQAQRHEQDHDGHEVAKLSGDLWKPHLNFIVPMKTSAGARPLKHYWASKPQFERDFRLLRRAWRRELSRVFGSIEGEVNLHYEFRVEPEKKKHALRYFARVFPGWSHAKLRARSFGYLSDRCLKDKAWDWFDDALPFWTRPAMRCSVCDKQLVDSGLTDRKSADEIRSQQREERLRKRLAG